MIREGEIDVIVKKELNKRERTKTYIQLFKKYGETAQLVVAIEELSELQKELCKDIRGKGKRENIIEEIADVSIMLEQLYLIYQIDSQEVNKVINKKLERTKGIL